MTRTRDRRNHRRASAALLGATALISMGVIGAIAGGQSDGKTAVISDASMMTGETTTVTYSGTIAPVVAAPPVKATPYGES